MIYAYESMRLQSLLIFFCAVLGIYTSVIIFAIELTFSLSISLNLVIVFRESR